MEDKHETKALAISKEDGERVYIGEAEDYIYK